MQTSPANDLFKRRVLGFIALGIVALGIVFCLPPIPQNPDYHRFADDRALWGISNFLNVASNIPFLIVGLLGLRWMLRPAAAMEPGERWPLGVLFAGVLLTGFGSAYYHLRPDNQRLVWDRLPMTVAFMGLFASIIAERIDPLAGKRLLWPLVWLGIASVIAWHSSEERGAGNLAFYAFVQFYPLITIPLLMHLFPARYTRSLDVLVALAWYFVAKILDASTVDRALYRAGHLVSGHTLKHLAAAMGAYWLYRMVRLRKPRTRPASSEFR